MLLTAGAALYAGTMAANIKEGYEAAKNALACAPDYYGAPVMELTWSSDIRWDLKFEASHAKKALL